MSFFNFFSKDKNKDKEKLNETLNKTKTSFLSRINKAISGKDIIDEEVLDRLEENLIAADIGVNTTIKIINKLEDRVKKDKYLNTKDIVKFLKEEILNVFELTPKNRIDISRVKPYIILVVGINGVGKTTTIGKLANYFKSNGMTVVLGAADTFRAAAIDQLKAWGKRVEVPVISHDTKKDPASIAFDTIKKAVDDNIDVAIIDTAGRLHNKVGLMNELGKMKKIINKFIPDAPHEILLVLDGSTGQNAFSQVKEFKEVTDVTDIAVTKLDGTAKGGVIIGLTSEFHIPVKYIGTGEKVDDIQLFDAKSFVDNLVGESF